MLRSKDLTLVRLADDVRVFLRSKNPAMARIRDQILAPIQSLGKTYVIGGLVRDIAMFGLNERPESDLDLVVRCSPSRLDQFAKSCGGIQNRFGGYAVRTNAYRVDFWAFANTWAKKAGHVQLKRPADLVKTTFFDWDAIVYGISEHKLWTIDRYLDRLNSGVLDINLVDNPSRLGTLVRALRRLMMWDARPGNRLRGYVIHELRMFSWNDILAAERHAFASLYLAEFSQQNEYVEFVLERSSFDNRTFDRLRQSKFEVVAAAPTAYEPIKKFGHLRVSQVRRAQVTRKKQAIRDLFAK